MLLIAPIVAVVAHASIPWSYWIASLVAGVATVVVFNVAVVLIDGYFHPLSIFGFPAEFIAGFGTGLFVGIYFVIWRRRPLEKK
jgi:hypothetical protein